ncbi:DUF3558 family protein [Lentzea cavernae]|uniref:DUF3558 domain-containing protein n=1 Tax=Lentzea cavernae TaxID=2020703 RepID=A0ABQ3MJ68_9PSEU|nr:DUF3558 family protein [Lentzea cavernae]GHH46287.1 hypothetical protein GCM10017774_48990 [Lentzea cavernae]
MKRILIATTIGLAVLTAGCTGTTGNANPTSTGGDPTPTSSSESNSGLGALKPCDLLTEAEVASLGLTYPGVAEQIASSDGCDWSKSGAGGIRAGIRTNAGVKDLSLDGEKISDIKVGKYDAKKVEAADRAKHLCTIAISVSESSSIVVIGSSGLTSDDTAAACERSSKAAELIAPKLP